MEYARPFAHQITTSMPKVYFASDHAGFQLKEKLIPYVHGLGYEVEDLGAHAFNPEDDYPDFITPCARRVAEENVLGGETVAHNMSKVFGVIVGGSGQGEAMAANRIPGVRAAVYYGEPARMQIDSEGKELNMIASVRAHNDANVLSLGGRFITLEEAKDVVKQFLETPFSGADRHRRRLAKF